MSSPVPRYERPRYSLRSGTRTAAASGRRFAPAPDPAPARMSMPVKLSYTPSGRGSINSLSPLLSSRRLSVCVAHGLRRGEIGWRFLAGIAAGVYYAHIMAEMLAPCWVCANCHFVWLKGSVIPTHCPNRVCRTRKWNADAVTVPSLLGAVRESPNQERKDQMRRLKQAKPRKREAGSGSGGKKQR